MRYFGYFCCFTSFTKTSQVYACAPLAQWKRAWLLCRIKPESSRGHRFDPGKGCRFFLWLFTSLRRRTLEISVYFCDFAANLFILSTPCSFLCIYCDYFVWRFNYNENDIVSPFYKKVTILIIYMHVSAGKPAHQYLNIEVSYTYAARGQLRLVGFH